MTAIIHSQDNTLGAQLTETLRDAIVSGEIAPGSKISEPKLAEKYQVSRGPLREAIRRLEAMNLVVHIPHGGARVITLDLPEVIEIYHAREVLEGKAAALAARNMTKEEIEHLRHLLELAESHMHETGGEYMQAESDFDFHYQIIQGSRNKALIRMLCQELYYQIKMYRYQSSLQPVRSREAFQEHQHLIYAIESSDEVLAETVMRQHIVRARKNIEQKMQNDAKGNNE